MRGIVVLVLVGWALAWGSPASAYDGDNGKWVNGKWVNGKWVNGKWVNGSLLDGPLRGGSFDDGQSMVWMWAGAGQLFALDQALEWRWGDGLRYATLVAALVNADGTPMTDPYGNRSTVELFVADVRAVPNVDDGHGHVVDNSEILGYELLAMSESYVCLPWGCMWLPVWMNACGDDGALAVPLEGEWDTRQRVRTGGARVSDTGITMACQTGALGKCALMGYKPWIAGRDAHQACTRMVRGDYCGDGRSLTYDGTDIEVVDERSPKISWDTRPWWGSLEAIWSADGATCMAQARWDELVTEMAGTGCVCPEWSDVPGMGVCVVPHWDANGNPVGFIPYGTCTPTFGDLWNKNGHMSWWWWWW